MFGQKLSLRRKVSASARLLTARAQAFHLVFRDCERVTLWANEVSGSYKLGSTDFYIFFSYTNDFFFHFLPTDKRTLINSFAGGCGDTAACLGQLAAPELFLVPIPAPFVADGAIRHSAGLFSLQERAA